MHPAAISTRFSISLSRSLSLSRSFSHALSLSLALALALSRSRSLSLGQEEPYMAYPQQGPQSPPSFQDILRAYGDQRAEGRDHRAYEDHYQQK